MYMCLCIPKADNYCKILHAKLLRVQDVDVVLSELPLAARQAISIVREAFHFVPHRLGKAPNGWLGKAVVGTFETLEDVGIW